MKTDARIVTAPAAFRAQMPRLYELRDLIGDPCSPNAYFQEFDNNLQRSAHIREIYARLENDLQGLDDTAWKFLKDEASPYLTRGDPRGRGWEQLFNILNQAHAYNYFKKLGCSNIRFIPRTRKPSPDLEAVLDGVRVLCEVKTINISQKELSARQQARLQPIARSIPIQLDAAFLTKLHSAITQATNQIHAHDASGGQRHYVYINICFDEFLAECKQQYYQQIDEYLSANPIPGINLVFHNDQTAFYGPLSMTNAVVVNAGE